MRFLPLSLLLVMTCSAWAQTPVSLKNDREGKSFIEGRKVRKATARAVKSVGGSQIVSAFNEILAKTTESKLCSFTLINQLNGRLRAINPKFKDLTGAFYHLRAQSEMDDVALKVILKAVEVQDADLYLPKQEEDLWLPSDSTQVSEMLKAIGAVPQKLKESCLDEVYNNLYSQILKINKKTKDYHFEALFVEAYKQNLIDINVYKNLERARVEKLHESPLTLKAYATKIRSLRTSFPLRDPSERSDYATGKLDKKNSRRQHLLSHYSDLQIMLMADVVKKLRSRLESPKVEILVYDRTQLQETILLEPMERFRFAIKVLRKEMAHMSLNTYFKGSSPSYADILTAAYETGIIPASELEEVSKLELIWNPKKSLWEKARYWVQAFGSVASILIPPPYGFIPALALVVIEMTQNKKDANADNMDLF